jgi:sulfonate transport system substrate-binding protein
MTIPSLPRRSLGAAMAGLLLGPAAGRAQSARKLQLSYQRSSSLLQLLRQSGRLEKALAPHGFTLDWSLLSQDVMRMGGVELHGDIAEPVPLFVHPANPTLTLYAAEGPSPHAVGLLVRDASPIRSLADLKGRTIGTSRGSSSHDIMLRALKQAQLTLRDVTPAYLPAPDAAAAFESGSIDAWAIFDPFFAVTQERGPIRVLADGATVGMQYDRYYMVNADFAAAHGEIVQIVFEALQDTGRWVTAHPKEAAPLLSQLWGNVPLSTVERVNARRVYDVRAIGPQDIANLQTLSDVFAEAGVLRRPLAASGFPVWTPRRATG